MRSARSWSFRAATGAFLISCAGCAGSTLGSGVGDTFLEHPPFYAGPPPAAGGSTAFAFLPVSYQRGASQAEIFEPAPGPEVASLLDAMTAYLQGSGGVGLAVPAVPARAPDVRFGCATDGYELDDACAVDEDGALGRGSQPMQLSVTRPSAEWVAWVDSSLAASGADELVVVTLEIGQYRIRQRGLRGTKEVELGTGHTVRFPWLTSLEGSVPVLQLTGAVVGRDGKARRIGAQGLLARRTSMTVSTLGAQSLVTDAEVRELLTARRDDLPGQPLVWEEAVRQLVTQLTGSSPERRADR